MHDKTVKLIKMKIKPSSSVYWNLFTWTKMLNELYKQCSAIDDIFNKTFCRVINELHN